MPDLIQSPARATNAGLARAAAVLAACLLATLGGCERPASVTVKNERPVMGTFARVTAVAADRDVATRAIEAAYARLDDVNRLMSDYLADSEIGRINALGPRTAGPRGMSGGKTGQGKGLCDRRGTGPRTSRCLEAEAHLAVERGAAVS